jgi:alpha-tubulin suppressor-like RCC1 family protein
MKYTEFLVSENNTLRLDNLKPNKMHLFKVSIKLDNFYSQLSESFIFFTMMHPENEDKKNNYYAWGNNEHNCMLINPTLSDQNNNAEIVSTPNRLQNSKVVDFTSSYDSTFLLLCSHQIISSGKFFAIDIGNGQVDSEFECEKAEKVNYFFSNPYAINMPWGVHVRKISCGLDFCVALDILGGAYSWGVNDLGQLGLNLPYDIIVNQPRKVTIKYEDSENLFAVDIQAGSKHVLCSVLANEKMRLFSWGFGQGVEPVFQTKEGVPEWMIESQLKKLTNAFSPMLIKFELSHKVVKIISAFNVNAIICREDSEKFVDINTVYTFGGVSNYQLGLNINFPESIHHWGFPTQVDFFTKNNLSVLDVSFSEFYTMFLVKNLRENKNEVYSCGTYDFNQTGFKEKISVRPQKVHNEIFYSAENEPVMIAAGKRQSAVLTKNNKIFIFGITDFKSKHSEFTGDKIRELTEFKLSPNEKLRKIKVMKNNIAILTYESEEK